MTNFTSRRAGEGSIDYPSSTRLIRSKIDSLVNVCDVWQWPLRGMILKPMMKTTERVR